MTNTDDLTKRHIRSYVLRQGRVTVAQQRAVDTLQAVYGIPYAPAPLNLETAFGRSAPKILEIGFGMGDSTASIAQENPQNDYLCLEVHTPGVGNLFKVMGEQNISNIRIIQHDAVEVLRDMIGDGTLDGVHIFFPDPWHKARHNKRRLIQAPFIEKLMKKLKPGGYIHVATDWENYAQQVLQVLSDEPLLENTATDYAPRPDYRPLTKFEKRGINLGHGVWDLVFIRKENL
ncbi:tRNA (guanosine(46)-N7)-methyltransferase TrmB [Gallionella capsiferriformans]|jgi:tRNA (guanine-N7-)-methyltransferase|uniref:tRNA (guanine-N(7)-)-methyltransferase n=1 Tax=Gallionella capsiferriformans (strain ES-2) TaxID=395494 RepID=D9SJU1_GALCS|nr:tRNA (guanosine(46)-N7)-methyltransferase TrmB [Gallionella capsiferriformans]ADL54440.1 tRNA (guanine-N(7)-)-methyltransferase [Gallionella capsiferriformans ES-2]